MKIFPNASLRSYHTLGFEVSARFLIIVESQEDLISLFCDASKHDLLIMQDGWLVLGEGSNLFFARDFEGSVIKMGIRGIRLLKEDDQFVYLEVGAGENWHHFVRHTLSMGWGGLENLTLIPGTVGAAPVQNIGAYGVEVETFILTVNVFDIVEQREKTLTHFECLFAYRDSIFKRSGKRRFIITRVYFRLEKERKPLLEYTPLRDFFSGIGKEAPSPLEVSDAVIEIRKSKLPDPAVVGNAGSFFKNPLISVEDLERLKLVYPNIPHFPSDNGFKVPAGWLIEQCGWKGFRDGAVGCYQKQALVLVHFGGGLPADLIDLARRIQHSVAERFSLHLEAEVNIAGETL